MHGALTVRARVARVASSGSGLAGWATGVLEARRAATERAPHPGDVPGAYLSSSPSFHGTVQSVMTWRKLPCVLTSVPSSSRRSKRRCFQQWCPLSSLSGKLYRVPADALAMIGLLPSCRRDQIAFKCPLRPYDGSTKPPSTSRLAFSAERKPSGVPSDA